MMLCRSAEPLVCHVGLEDQLIKAKPRPLKKGFATGVRRSEVWVLQRAQNKEVGNLSREKVFGGKVLQCLQSGTERLVLSAEAADQELVGFAALPGHVRGGLHQGAAGEPMLRHLFEVLINCCLGQEALKLQHLLAVMSMSALAAVAEDLEERH